MRKLLALLFLFALPAFAVNKRRDDIALTTLGSGLAPATGYYVSVLPVGAEASASSSGTTISVRSGHGFSNGQKCMVGTDTTKVRTVQTANATSLVLTSAVTVSSGDIIVNLGADTGSGPPSWNDATIQICSDMACATTTTPSWVLTNSSGAYGYWHTGTAAWEVLRKANGTVVAVNRGAVMTDLGSGLTIDPAACSANQYVTDIAQTGATTCSALDTDLATFGNLACADGEIPKKSTGQWTCGSDAAGGGLPADPSACGANLFVTDQNASGVLSCTQPAFSNLSGSATDAQIPDTITASNYQPVDTDLTTFAGLACASGEVAKFTTVWTCGTDNSGTLADGDKGDVVVSGSGAAWDIDTGVIVNADVNASAAIAATKLETAVIVSTEIDTSTEIAAIVGDETGTGVLVLATGPTITSPLTVSGGSDDTRGIEITDNPTTCANPASGNTSICTIGGEPFTRDTGGTAREMLYTAGGDYGDVTCVSGSCTLDAGTVAWNAEIADDLSCGALQAVRRNAGDAAWECFTPATATIPKHTECFTLFDAAGLADTNDIPSVWRAPAAVTVTEVWSETDAGTPSINLQRDDGTAANVLSANLTPTTGGATGTIDTAEDNFADGDRLDFVMVSASTAKRINVCVEYTFD